MLFKPLLLVTRKLSPEVEARAARDYDVVFNPDDRTLSTEALIAACQDMDAVLPCHSEHFTAAVIAALPDRLQVIANHSVGVDHVDLGAAAARGIIVTNTPDVLSDATAEIAILCMLGAARRGAEGDRMVREDRWNSWSPSFMVGKQITGKRFGVMGMGRVGLVTAARARGFGMEIHYHNRRPLTDAQAVGAIYHDTPESLIAQSDVLSLHCPASPETTGLMNAARIELIPWAPSWSTLPGVRWSTTTSGRNCLQKPSTHWRRKTGACCSCNLSLTTLQRCLQWACWSPKKCTRRATQKFVCGI